MADRKFVSVDGSVSSPAYSADYESSRRFDKLNVGSLGVYFREGFRTHLVPYERMERAFLRIHEVNGKLCCGSTVFQYFRLVFVVGGREFADVISENEQACRDALEAIRAAAPAVAIGYEKTHEEA